MELQIRFRNPNDTDHSLCQVCGGSGRWRTVERLPNGDEKGFYLCDNHHESAQARGDVPTYEEGQMTDDTAGLFTDENEAEVLELVAMSMPELEAALEDEESVVLIADAREAERRGRNHVGAIKAYVRRLDALTEGG